MATSPTTARQLANVLQDVDALQTATDPTNVNAAIDARTNVTVQSLQSQIQQLQAAFSAAQLAKIDISRMADVPASAGDGTARTFAQWADYVNQKAGQGGTGGPTAPTVNAAPTTTLPSLGTVTMTLASPCVFTLNGHGRQVDDEIVITTTGSLYTGIPANTPIYVIAAGLTANNFEASLTKGGAAINSSGSQSGTHTLRRGYVPGDVPVYNWGTYNGTTPITSRDVTTTLDGVVIATNINVSNGGNLTALPPTILNGNRAVKFTESGHYAGESAPVPNPSRIFIADAARATSAPVKVTNPVITPANGTDLTTFRIVPGSYTVNGIAVATSSLNPTYEHLEDRTLTASLTGATSATLTQAWPGPANPTFVFSDDSRRATTLAVNGTAVSWTGAVTASANVQIVVSSIDLLPPPTPASAYVGRTIHGYETVTNAGGSLRTECTNTIIPTASSSTLEPGRNFLSSIPSATLDLYDAVMAAYPPTQVSRVVLVSVRNRLNSIPTTATTTLSGSQITAANINAALAALPANGMVLLSGPAGTYPMSTGLVANGGNKWLKVADGIDMRLDFQNGALAHALTWNGNGGGTRNLQIYRAQRLALWMNGDNQTHSKISIIQAGFGREGWMAVLSATAYFNNALISYEIMQTIGGGNSDGADIGRGGGNFVAVDGFGDKNDDDFLDVWDYTARCYLLDGIAQRSGQNDAPGAISGDGNGVKLGPANGTTDGNVIFRFNARNNNKCGYNPNPGTTVGVRHVLIDSVASSNAASGTGGNYNFGDNTPSPNDYIVVSNFGGTPPPSPPPTGEAQNFKQNFSGVGPYAITAPNNFNGSYPVFVVLQFFTSPPSDVTGITVCGTAMTPLPSSDPGAAIQSQVFYALTNAGGSKAIVISAGTNPHAGSAFVLEYIGPTALDSGTENISNTGTTNPTVSTNAATTTTNTLLIAGSASYSGTTPNNYTQPTGWTSMGTESDGAGLNSGAAAYKYDTSGTGVKTATWTQSDPVASRNVIAAFKMP